MAFSSTLISSIAALAGLILFTTLLRHRGFLKEEHGTLFSNLVMNVTLPALVFTAVNRSTLRWEDAELAMLLLLGEVLCLTLAWGIGCMMKLGHPQMGALILTSGFGSSAFLGYAVITQVFPGNEQALEEVVILSEIGFVPALFTLGVLIASYYGSAMTDTKRRISEALSFFWSPVFLSLVLGLICSTFSYESQSVVWITFINALEILGRANTLMIVLAIGALLRFENLEAAIFPVIAACMIKLVMQPLIVWFPMQAMDVSTLAERVLVLEGGMPSATVAVVICNRYGCDARLGSVILFIMVLVSPLSILGLLLLI